MVCLFLLRSRGRLDQFDDWLGRSEVRVFLLVLLAALYLQAYITEPALPGNVTVRGWWDWFDQPRYWHSSNALSHFSITPDDYWYPLGYPLIGAPFIRVFPNHAFLIPNLLFALGIASLFVATCHIFLRRWESLLVTLFLIVALKRDLTLSLIQPWNTIPTHFLSYLIIFLYLKRRSDWRLVLLLSALTALVLLCRPLDAVALAPILVAATLSVDGLRGKFLSGAGGIGLLLLMYLSTRMINLHVFGTWNTSYERGSAFRGLFSYDISQKLYSIFADGLPVYQTTDPMLFASQPWLLLIIPGVIYAIIKNRRTLPVFGSLLLSLFLYANYNDMGSRFLYGTGLIHYFAWSFPLLGLFAYLAVRHAWQELAWPMYAALIVFPVLCVASIRLDVADQQPACISSVGKVEMKSSSERTREAYFEVAVLRVQSPEVPIELMKNGTPLYPIRDFRQIWGPEQSAIALHFAEAVNPSAEGFRILAPTGTPVVFHTLEWRFAVGESRLWAGISRRFGLALPFASPSSVESGASVLDVGECYATSVSDPGRTAP
jgi:hypothetical protein